MAKPEWGKKRICQSCGVRFYDLKRKSIACPKCGSAYDPTPPAKAKRATQAAAPKLVPKPVPLPKAAAAEIPPDDDLDALEEEGDEEDETPAAAPGGLSAKKAGDEAEELIEDASDLGEDEDDIGEVKEHIDNGVGDKP